MPIGVKSWGAIRKTSMIFFSFLGDQFGNPLFVLVLNCQLKWRARSTHKGRNPIHREKRFQFSSNQQGVHIHHHPFSSLFLISSTSSAVRLAWRSMASAKRSMSVRWLRSVSASKRVSGQHEVFGASESQDERNSSIYRTCQRRGGQAGKGAPIKQKRPASLNPQVVLLFGTPERIRTPNLLIRSQMLYPVELRVHSV